MLSPFAIHHLLKHFDSIDRAVTSKMTYPRPKDEEELTGSLVDMLDERVQVRESIGYNIQDLRHDLTEASEPLGVKFSIETHKYKKEFEGRVSQADLGLIVNYENNFEPHLSGRRSWLLQAKRVYPTSLDPTRYNAQSIFGALNAKQDQRIQELIKFVGDDFFRYLLYCPRPEILEEEDRLELAYYRGKSFQENLFDFAYGLELRDDIRNGSKTVAAGIYVSSVQSVPKCLGEVHAGIFDRATPLSWFLVQHLPGRLDRDWEPTSHLQGHDDTELASKIVRGDPEVVDIIADVLSDKNWTGTMLPAATLTVTLTAGAKNVRDRFRLNANP